MAEWVSALLMEKLINVNQLELRECIKLAFRAAKFFSKFSLILDQNHGRHRATF